MLFNICVMKFVILMLGSLRTSQKGDTVTIYKVKIYIYIYIFLCLILKVKKVSVSQIQTDNLKAYQEVF